MNLLETQAKKEFSKSGIPVPKGQVITDVNQTENAAANLHPPFMVKAQIPAGGRGKAGGILSAKSVQEAKDAAVKLLGTQIKGLPVKQVLLEEKLPVKKELYVGITVDRFNRSYAVLASTRGGVDIEEVAERTPKAIIKTSIDSYVGLRSFHALEIAKKLGYSGKLLVELSDIIQKLYRGCVECDAEMVEINPLVETESSGFVAADARMVIDDNALFRHPNFEAQENQWLSSQEASALKHNLAYVKLDGDIGVVGNGAGLVMATLDLLKLFGGNPADFLDLGGGANIENIKVALQIVLNDPEVKVVVVNVLGGITHCDDVAKGIVQVTKEMETQKPLVVRLVGTNQSEGQKILADEGIDVLESMQEAAKRAVEISRGAK